MPSWRKVRLEVTRGASSWNVVVVAIWVDTCALRLSVVSTVGTVRGMTVVTSLGVAHVGAVSKVRAGGGIVVNASVCLSVVVSWIIVLDEASVSASWAGSRTSVAGVVRSTSVMVVVVCGKSACSDASTNGTKLGILFSGILVLASEQSSATTARTRGVVVGWRWTEALLLLVVTDKSDLHQSSQEEKESTDDRDSKDRGVQSAGKTEMDGVSDVLAAARTESIGAVSRARVRRTIAEGSVDIALAAAGAASSQNSHCDETTDHADINDNGDESKEADTTETASQEDRADGVDDRNARNALNGLFPFCNRRIAVSEDREEVGVDSEDDACATEGEKVEEGLEKTLGASFDDTHDRGIW